MREDSENELRNEVKVIGILLLLNNTKSMVTAKNTREIIVAYPAPFSPYAELPKLP